MTKGTQAFGKKHNKSHTLCPRCGKRSLNTQTKVCASCSYPSSSMRRYNWSQKAKRRRTEGTGRMKHLKLIRRIYKNGSKPEGIKVIA